jgi:hypothetical protein
MSGAALGCSPLVREIGQSAPINKQPIVIRRRRSEPPGIEAHRGVLIRFRMVVLHEGAPGWWVSGPPVSNKRTRECSGLTELSFAALRLSFKPKVLHSKWRTATNRTLRERQSQSGVKPPHSKVRLFQD